MKPNVAKNLIEVPPQIIARISPPHGWKTVEEIVQPAQARQPLTNEIDIKRTLSITLPLATRKAELLIKEMERRYEIRTTEFYLTIDSLNSFHLVILVSRSDYLSRKCRL